MATPKIVPRAAGEGALGDAAYGWGGAFVTNTTADSSTQGGKLVLTANDGAAMQSGSRLGVVEFSGAEDGSNTLVTGARIEAITDVGWSATRNGTELRFITTTGDAVAAESLRLSNSQVLGLVPLKIQTGADSTSLNITSSNATADAMTMVTTSTTTGGMINITDNSGDTGTRKIFNIWQKNSAATGATAFTVLAGANSSKPAVLIDRDVVGTGAVNSVGLHVDFDRTVPGSGTDAHGDIGIDLDVNSASLGTSTVKGMDIDVVGATSGTHTATGIDLSVTAADTNIGASLIVADGGTDIICKSSADNADYFSIATTANGATTLTTVDDGAAAAHLTVTVDGHMVLGAGSAAELNILNGQAQYDSVWNTNGGRELARMHNGDVTQTDADIVAVTHGFGWKHPVFKIDATGGDKTATLVAEQSGAIFHCLAAANNITINLPAADSRNVGIWFIFTAFEAVSGSKTIVINTNGTDGNDKFMMFGFNASTAIGDVTGDTLTFPNSTVIGTTVKVTCISPGAEDAAEIWLAEVHGSPAITNA